MHNAPPVMYPVGRCALCGRAFYVVGVLQLLLLVATAHASQPAAGQRWPWVLAAGVLLLWLLANALVGAKVKQQVVCYLAWQYLGREAVWQLQTREYSEPVPLASTAVALDMGFCALVRVSCLQGGSQWLWLFERDSPGRWLAMRRALMAIKPA
ncbi:hypothetical protein LN050_00135 [Comamonadaceae bacterium M7527]|nr:hypothetical protein LN050_00135 [Comamonadaceae bacterium M7527]